MRRSLSITLLMAAAASGCFAAMDGTVVNQTTGKPEAGVSVTLVKPGQGGMRTLGHTVTDAAGHFAFEKDEPGGGPQLLQATYKGVNYNKLMTPNLPTSNIELDVYEATKSAAVVHVAQQMLVLEPTTSQLGVNETVIVENNTKTTYDNDALGAFRFYLPPAANGQVRVNAQGPQGMPLPRPAEKTKQADVFQVNFAVKPGQTEFEINYVLPVGSPLTYHGRVVKISGMETGPLRLVAPPGVTLSGSDIESVGTEPKTQATIYNVVRDGNFSVSVSGTGSLHNGDDATPTDNSDAPQVTEGKPQIYAHLPWLLGLALSVLGVGLLVLYRSSPVQAPYGK